MTEDHIITEENSATDTVGEINDIHTDTQIDDPELPKAEEAPTDDIDALRAEISRLRQELIQKDSEQERLLRELEDFNRLFPDVSIRALPEEVVNKVNGGIPLSAAYALYEKEASLLKSKAMEVNLRNASLSAGKAGTETKGEYFSPDEVRAMSQKEVHENYPKIRKSMKHWR